MASTAFRKFQKEKVVQDILADVPRQNYYSQASDLFQRIAKSRTPPEVLAVLATPKGAERLANLRFRLDYSYTVRGSTKTSWDIFCALGLLESDLEGADFSEVKTLLGQHKAQVAALWELEKKLESAFEPHRTFASAVKAMPEFRAYIERACNVEPPMDRSLPVVQVIPDLVALGWPKGSNDLSGQGEGLG